MSRRRPLPSMLPESFRIDEGRAAGVSAKRMRGRDLVAPFRGVRSDPGSSAVMAYRPLLRAGDRFSHTTAAELWGIPLPWPRDARLHVTAGPGLTAPRGRGVAGHESTTGHTAMRHGLPVSDPVTVFRELASTLTLDALVAAGDHLVLEPRFSVPGEWRPFVEIDELRRVVITSSGRGVRRAREAVALVRPGVESPRETALRLLCHRAGLPEPVCGYELRDSLGRRIGFFDLAWPAHRAVAEYDGDQHRTSREQYEKDIRRFDRAADEGWTTTRVRSHGLAHASEETVARITRSLLRGGWRA